MHRFAVRHKGHGLGVKVTVVDPIEFVAYALSANIFSGERALVSATPAISCADVGSGIFELEKFDANLAVCDIANLGDVCFSLAKVNARHSKTGRVCVRNQ